MSSQKLVFQISIVIGIWTYVNCDLVSNLITRKADPFNLEELKNAQTPYQLIETLRRQVLAKEDELVKAEQINKNFEKMIQLVNILGQVDSFLTDRTKTMIKKIAMLADADDGEFEKEFKQRHRIN